MPKKNRLTGAEIRGMRSPRRVHGTLFSVTVAKSAARQARCACVVSKKVAAKAVDRNTIKRRCRAALQKAALVLPPGSYVFSAKKVAAGVPYAALEKDIERLVRMFAEDA